MVSAVVKEGKLLGRRKLSGGCPRHTGNGTGNERQVEGRREGEEEGARKGNQV